MTRLRWGWEETLRAPLPALILARRHARRSEGRPKDFGWAMLEHLSQRKERDVR